MAKSRRVDEDKNVKKMPSVCGSHTSMIVQELTDKLENPNDVILEGESGLYATTRDRLDTKLADPNRYASTDYRVRTLKTLLADVLHLEICRTDDKVFVKEEAVVETAAVV